MNTNNLSKKVLSLLIALSFVLINCQNPILAQEKSLYERLGGVYQIAAVVDDFVDKLLVDPIITANKNTVSGLAHITKPGLKYLITEMLSQAAGGPQKYTGKPMKEAHKDLKISEAEWEAMVKDFLSTLAKFKVPNKEQIELVVIVGNTKSDIVSLAPAAPQAVQPAPAPAFPQAPAPQAAHPVTQPAPAPALPQAPAPQAAHPVTQPAPAPIVPQAPAPQAAHPVTQPAPAPVVPQAPAPQVAPQADANQVQVIPVVPAQPEAVPDEVLPPPSDLPPDAQIVPAE